MPDAYDLFPKDYRQCNFTRKSGRQCGRAAAAGSEYCWTHSSSDLRDELLEARDEARAWLISQLDKALLKLTDLIDSEDDRVALNASCQLLDRAGVTSLTRTQLDAVVTHSVVDPSIARVDSEIENLLSRAITTVTSSREFDEERMAAQMERQSAQAQSPQPSQPAPEPLPRVLEPPAPETIESHEVPVIVEPPEPPETVEATPPKPPVPRPL